MAAYKVVDKKGVEVQRAEPVHPGEILFDELEASKRDTSECFCQKFGHEGVPFERNPSRQKKHQPCSGTKIRRSVRN